MYDTYAEIMHDLEVMTKKNYSNRPKVIRATIKMGGSTEADMRHAVVHVSVDLAKLGIQVEYKGM